MNQFNSNSSFRNKVVAVTGGSSGLGLSIAKAFATAGSKLILAGRDVGRLNAASAKIGDEYDILTCVTDVCRDEQVEHLVATTIQAFGRLDVLVNCAGASTRKAIQETTLADFRSMWEMNFLSAVRCTQVALPHLLDSRGHVVNIGSLASKIGTPYLGAYPTSKFPLAAYSQQLRLELKELGLHVLLVCPGPIRRDDAGHRYDSQTQGIPAAARKPGGGSRLKMIDSDWLANRIVTACRRREKELVVPWKARLLFAIAQIWPSWGDWIISRSLHSGGRN